VGQTIFPRFNAIIVNAWDITPTIVPPPESRVTASRISTLVIQVESLVLHEDPDLCFSNSTTTNDEPTDDDHYVVDPNHIVIDPASTVDLFANPHFLVQNIRQATTSKIGSEQLTIHSNGGVSSTNVIGDLPGFGPVWLDPRAIANVLSLASV
jgi:hypothetical protein